MEVLMGVLRVDAEVEVAMMTADTHVDTEIAQMRQAAETVTSTEVVVVCAHALEAPEITIALEGTVAIAMMQMESPEMIAETEMKVVDQVEAPNERVPLL
jgi:hypothetical protein